MLTNYEIDAVSRNRIVEEIDKNFFVEAGAGSGKTTMLVNRMVAMVESGIPIDRICAITFTKAAAGVFYRRFHEILMNRSNPTYKYEDKHQAGQLPKPTPQGRKNCEDALKKIDLCFMGTIDSFCNRVLGEHPSEAGIPADTEVVSEEDIKAILKQEYVKIIGGGYGQELSDMARTFSGMHWDPESVFVRGMDVIMNNRNASFHYEEYESVDVDRKFKAEREELLSLLAACRNHADEIQYTGNKDSISAWENLSSSYSALSKTWSLDINGVIKALKKLSGLNLIKGSDTRFNLDMRFLNQGSKAIKLTIGDSGELIDQLLTIQYSASMTFLCNAVERIEKTMKETGTLSFYDYLLHLRNMLRDDAAREGRLIKYIYKRHSYFLIDEFQDTNPMQAEIFFYLTAQNPKKNWEECDPRPGSLFIVGDPKQSIYRFRNADVTSFKHVKGLFENGVGETLKLTRNFRSTRELCGFYNSVFTKLLPEDTDDQSKFEVIPLPDESKDLLFGGIYSYPCYEGDKGRDAHPDETDEKQLVKIIKALVGNSNYRIVSEGEETPRTIQYKDFMIITKSKTHLDRYISEFEANDIPVKTEGKVLFETCEALKAVYSIYAAVSDIYDEVALNRALKCALIHQTDEMLVNYKNTGRNISLKPQIENEELSDLDDKLKKVDDALVMLRKISHEANSMSPAALFVRIMDSFRIFEFVSSDHMEIIYYTLELIRNAEQTGLIISHKDGAEFILNLINGGSDEERCLRLKEDQDCVHMANLHKVKGLEAPIVVLASAYNFKKEATIRVEYTHDGVDGYIFVVKDNESSDFSYPILETREFKDTKQKEEESCVGDENDRLIYVGATRAKNALLVCDSKYVYPNGDRRMSAWGSTLLAQNLPNILDELQPNEDSIIENQSSEIAKTLYDSAEKDSALRNRLFENPTHTTKIPSMSISHKSDENVEREADELDREVQAKESDARETNAHKVPSLLGTATHKLMEMMVLSGSKITKTEAVDRIISDYVFGEYEVFEKDIRNALCEVFDKVKDGGYPQSNGIQQDILGTFLKADEVYCEVPFCYSEDGEEGKVIWNGIMDVVYCAQGKWHIVDYKTNADGTDLDEKYKGQLDAYVRAFKATTGQDADAMTYHIAI